jgi:hypothetical protein
MRFRIALILAVGFPAVVSAAPFAMAAETSPHGGHVPATALGPVPAHVQRTVGRAARPAVGGGYNIRLSTGRVLHTHGPDTVARMAKSERRLGIGGPERAPVCATGPYAQHVLYGRVTGSPDNLPAQASVIRGYIRELNHMLNESALASSGGAKGADFIVRCEGVEIAIGSFQAPAPIPGDGEASMDAIVNAAIAAGYSDERVDYTIFFDHSAQAAGMCGIASIGDDDSLSENNINNNPPGAGAGYAVTYGGPSATSASANCWNTTTAMHENAHNQGAVQDSASNSTGFGHCVDGTDVMCYDDGGPNGASFSELVCADEVFDCNNDDYFDVAPAPGSYLDTRWNLGSPLNRFIRIADTVGTVGIATNLSVPENVGNAVVTVQRTGAQGAFSVDLATAPGSATTADFTSTALTLEFAAGEMSKTVPIAIRNDALREAAESFTVALSNPTDGVVLGQANRTITIRASDQQPDGYIKLSGGSFRGGNVYNATALNQTVASTARRGQTRTFYVTVQNDGNVRNTLRVKAANSSGTSIVVNGSSTITNSVRSLSGRSVALNPGASVTFRVDFKMLSGASGTEQFTFRATWSGDRVLTDLVRGTVRV